MFKVTVSFDANVLHFTFKNLADALQFIGECIETSECTGTVASIVEVE